MNPSDSLTSAAREEEPEQPAAQHATQQQQAQSETENYDAITIFGSTAYGSHTDDSSENESDNDDAVTILSFAADGSESSRSHDDELTFVAVNLEPIEFQVATESECARSSALMSDGSQRNEPFEFFQVPAFEDILPDENLQPAQYIHAEPALNPEEPFRRFMGAEHQQFGQYFFPPVCGCASAAPNTVPNAAPNAGRDSAPNAATDAAPNAAPNAARSSATNAAPNPGRSIVLGIDYILNPLDREPLLPGVAPAPAINPYNLGGPINDAPVYRVSLGGSNTRAPGLNWFTNGSEMGTTVDSRVQHQAHFDRAGNIVVDIAVDIFPIHRRWDYPGQPRARL